MPRFAVRPQAYADLEEITRHIADSSLASAARFFDAAQETFRQLAASPELGAKYTELDSEVANLRIWQIKGFSNYVVFYRPVDIGVEVVRVFHGARNWQDLIG
jgi:toxin ParE1/3/4